MIVRRIYRQYIEGHGIDQIAVGLERDKIIIPTVYARIHGHKVTGIVPPNGDFAWKATTVQKILTSQEYCGDVVNFKTYRKSYKIKKRMENPLENQMVFEDVHEPIIERELWQRVQKQYGRTRVRQTVKSEKNMFAGLLVCSTCGGNLAFHFNQKNHSLTYFNCRTYNNRGKERGQCDATHHIRTDFLEQVVLGDIKRITAFAKHYEDDFLRILTTGMGDEMERQLYTSEQQIRSLKARNKELDSLFERIYEDNLSGKLTDDRFAKMSRKYEDEQAENEAQIVMLSREVASKKSTAGSARDFLATVKRYTRMKKLTPEILREFVDKIVVHHRERISVAGKDSPAAEVQKVEIFYNCVGAIDVPDLKKIPQTEIHIPTRKGVAVSYATA